jgi:hypothetical protein
VYSVTHNPSQDDALPCRYLKESIAALASSPQIKKHFADPTAPAFRVFTPMAAVAKAGALSASRSIARSADGASDASATLASQPPKESQHPPQQLKQFDVRLLLHDCPDFVHFAAIA